jgi:DNA-binding YbaB/EbfC family protein
MKNLAGLMKQASQMQQKMAEIQTALESAVIEGSAGAGMVSVTMNGKGELRAIHIDPKMVDPNEVEMLQDLLLAAHADAKRKTEVVAAEEMKKATGGLELPAGMKLPF